MVKREVQYFEEFGSQHTATTIEAAKKAALELGLKYVIVASGSGSTGVMTAEAFKGTDVRVVVVTEYVGAVEFDEENRIKMEEHGAKVVTSTHAFLSPAESLTNVYGGYCSENTIIKEVLRRFSQGTKVAAEIVVMATDAGAVPVGEDVIAIAGTSSGADTAIVIKSCHTDAFFDKEKGIQFKEIIALPRNKKL